MKKLIALILSIVSIMTVCFCMTGCKKDKNEYVDVTTKQITVGYTIYSPMNYKENGVLKGFDTELALVVFNALGYDVKFTPIEWSQKYLELDGGSIDCVWNGFTMNSSDKINGVDTPRDQIVSFTKPYMYNAQCIVRLDSTPDISNATQFAQKSVAYEAGSAAVDFVDTLENINKKPLASQMDALKEVKAGTADYAVVDVILAKANAGKGNYANLAINQGLAMAQELYAIAFKNGSPLTAKVNTMLKALAETGVLMEIATKYGLQDVVITNFN